LRLGRIDFMRMRGFILSFVMPMKTSDCRNWT